MGKFTNSIDFERFYKRCELVYNNFKLYGESVLKVEFADSDEREQKLMQLFKTVSEESFEKEIIKFWKNNYILVINKPSDFNKLPNYHRSVDDIFMHQRCTTQKIQISDDFYKRLFASKQYICTIATVCARDDEYIYIVELNKKSSSLRLISQIPLSEIVTE